MIYQLRVVQSVQQGLADAGEGRVVAHAAAMREIRERWLAGRAKSSGRGPRSTASRTRFYEPDGVDLEFVLGSGRTQAVVTLNVSDVRPMVGDDVLTVRRAARTK